MNRSFSILSIMSLLTLVIYSLLMVFEVLNPIIHVKFLVIVFSLFFTFLSLGLFLYRQEINRLRHTVIVILLILPVFTPLMGVISAEAYLDYWKLFIGGMIFQMGTGIYALLGGFVKNGISSSLKVIAIINYSLFLFLSAILFFDISVLMEGIVFVTIGIAVSLLSLLIVLLRKPTMSL